MRFLGRRVYVGAAVLLASVIALAFAAVGAARRVTGSQDERLGRHGQAASGQAKDEGVSLSSLLARGLQRELVVATWQARGGTSAAPSDARRRIAHGACGAVARLAGTAVGVVGAGVADAIVIASASLRGGLLYTSGLDGVERLTKVFRDVRVVAVRRGGSRSLCVPPPEYIRAMMGPP